LDLHRQPALLISIQRKSSANGHERLTNALDAKDLFIEESFMSSVVYLAIESKHIKLTVYLEIIGS
jgi:hypothetical protein